MNLKIESEGMNLSDKLFMTYPFGMSYTGHTSD